MSRTQKKTECGHPQRRHKARGLCASCYGLFRRATSAAAYETARAADRRYHRSRAIERNAARRERTLRERYGLSAADVTALLEAQQHKCAMCYAPLGWYHIDHNHTTGRPRGLLCARCNSGLGHYERPGFLEQAQRYLANYA